ncbi:MAG: CPBP family intramembrane metalloprotease [Lachnospiraceae bacterium]|nr:CPBP family intramembrane metalloprotease [Lachnospiraceae bacterium]
MAGLFTAEGIVIILHFLLGKNIFAGEIFDTRTITLITYYGYIIVVGVAIIYWKLIEKKPLSEMGITKYFGNYFIGAAIGVFLLFISVVAIVLTGAIEFYGIFENIDRLMIFLLIGGFIIQGATEEILCRGIVLHALKEKTSLWVAVVISTIVFVLPHGIALFENEVVYGIIGVTNLILISIIFSLLTIRFTSIWAACGLHSFWNAILYSVFGLNLSGSNEAVTAVLNMQSVGSNILNGGAYGIEASIITSMVLFVAVAFLVHAGKHL